VFTRFGAVRPGAAQALVPLLALLALSSCAEAPEPGPSAAASEPASSESATPAGSPAAAAAESTAATSETVTTIAAALAEAGRAKPYSAQVNVRSLIGEQLATVMSGRINFNAPSGVGMTGRLNVRTTALDTTQSPMSVQEVMTDGTFYVREIKNGGRSAGKWQRLPKAATGAPFADLSDYARLLLLAGPSAVKGEEKQGGIPATRLSGQIQTEQIRSVEPNLYGRLRTAAVESFACDIWIDGSGRTIRLDQWVRMQGLQAHNIMTLSKFRAPLKVKAPTK
jgi:hypothetical protein